MNSNNNSVIAIVQSGLVLGCTLAWSDTISSIAKKIYPQDTSKAVEAKIIYSICLTLIVIVVFYILQKAVKQANKINKIAKVAKKEVKKTDQQINKIIDKQPSKPSPIYSENESESENFTTYNFNPFD